MLDLCDVFEFVIDGFDNSSLSKQKLVRHAHHSSFHIVPEFGHQLYSVYKKTLEQIFTDVALVTDKPSVYVLYESPIFQWFSVIYIAWSEHEVQQFAFHIANQMQFESKEPAHRVFASFRYPLEYLMHMNPLIAAHSQRSTVYKTYSGTFAKQHFLDKNRSGMAELFCISTNIVYDTVFGKRCLYLLQMQSI